MSIQQSAHPLASVAKNESSDSQNHGAAALAATISDPKESASQTGIVMMLVLAFLAGIFVASKASGQGAFPYDSVEMPQALNDDAVVRRVEGIAKSYATSGTGDPAMVNGYFKVYVPAKMTAPDGVKEISTVAQEAANLLVRAQRSSNSQVAQQITVLLFDGMKGVAEGNYHPAARINAILLLSRLDRQAANPAAKTPPIPLIQTLPILLSLYQDTNHVDGERAAALHGLHRHVRFGFPQITPADKATLTQEMSALLAAQTPQGRNPQAHAYLQRFAVDILDTLRPAEDNSLGTQLISISTEPKRPDLIALYSASRFGPYGPALQGQVAEPRKVLNSWGNRVLDAFESEIDRYDRMEKAKPVSTQPVNPESFLEKKTTETNSSRGGGTGGEMGMDMQMEDEMGGMMGDMERGSGMEMGDMDMDMDMGMGMEMGMEMGMGMSGGRGGAPPEKPQPPEVIATRKKLNYVLQQVHLGMTGFPRAGLPTQSAGGLLASATPEQKPTVERWVTALEGVVTVLNDKSLDDMDKFRTGIEEQIVVLRELVSEEIAALPEGELPDELTPVDPLAELAPVANPANANPANANPANANPAIANPANANSAVGTPASGNAGAVGAPTVGAPNGSTTTEAVSIGGN